MKNRIDPAKFADAIYAFLGSSDVGALTWPVHVAIVFDGGTMTYFRVVDGEPPDLVTATGTPAQMFVPANGIAIDARGRRLDFVWNDREIEMAAKQQAKN